MTTINKIIIILNQYLFFILNLRFKYKFENFGFSFVQCKEKNIKYVIIRVIKEPKEKVNNKLINIIKRLNNKKSLINFSNLKLKRIKFTIKICINKKILNLVLESNIPVIINNLFPLKLSPVTEMSAFRNEKPKKLDLYNKPKKARK